MGKKRANLMVTMAERLLTASATTNGTIFRPEFRHSARLSLRFKHMATSRIIDSSVRKFRNGASSEEIRRIDFVFSTRLTFRGIKNNNLG